MDVPRRPRHWRRKRRLKLILEAFFVVLAAVWVVCLIYGLTILFERLDRALPK